MANVAPRPRSVWVLLDTNGSAFPLALEKGQPIRLQRVRDGVYERYVLDRDGSWMVVRQLNEVRRS